jgi:hypothetical protein
LACLLLPPATWHATCLSLCPTLPLQHTTTTTNTCLLSLPHPHPQIADKIGLPGLYLHEAVEDESVEGTGNLIWTAGVRLSSHLVKNRGGELKGARVLDIGSGTGERGMCAGAACAKGVSADAGKIRQQQDLRRTSLQPSGESSGTAACDHSTTGSPAQLSCAACCCPVSVSLLLLPASACLQALSASQQPAWVRT